MADGQLRGKRRPIQDLTGKTFGRLTVTSFAGMRGWQSLWKCRCECGTEKVILGRSLNYGATNSCGCLHKETISRTRLKHSALFRSPTYRCWDHMIQRCTNPNNSNYHYYGGRGVSVCERWLSFDDFVSDMGERPSMLYSLDRFPDQNGNYEPGNVRWATDAEQSRNTRRNHLITINGETKCLTDWAKQFCVSPMLISARIHKLGWNPEEAVCTPARKKRSITLAS